MACWLLLPLVLIPGVVYAELDCIRGLHLIPSGTSIQTSGCERHTCRNGVMMREFCSPIPSGCTPVPGDKAKIYPNCCPNWCCGDDHCGEGADIVYGPIADFKGGCVNGEELVPNGNTFFTESCEKPYPACCPSYCCGKHCGEANVLEPGHCTTGPYIIPDGGHLQTMECNRLSCKNGTLLHNLCFPIPPQCTTIPGEAGMPFPLCCDRRGADCSSTFVDRSGRKIEDTDDITDKRQGKKRLWFSAAVECNPETGTCQSVKPVIITPDMTTPKPVYPEDALTKPPMVVKPGEYTKAPEDEDEDEEIPVIVHPDNVASKQSEDLDFEDFKEMVM